MKMMRSIKSKRYSIKDFVDFITILSKYVVELLRGCKNILGNLKKKALALTEHVVFKLY